MIVLGLGLANELLDGDILTRFATFCDLLELEDAEIEVALGLLLLDGD